jgi:hypothetical protein
MQIKKKGRKIVIEWEDEGNFIYFVSNDYSQAKHSELDEIGIHDAEFGSFYCGNDVLAMKVEGLGSCSKKREGFLGLKLIDCRAHNSPVF